MADVDEFDPRYEFDAPKIFNFLENNDITTDDDWFYILANILNKYDYWIPTKPADSPVQLQDVVVKDLTGLIPMELRQFRKEDLKDNEKKDNDEITKLVEQHNEKIRKSEGLKKDIQHKCNNTYCYTYDSGNSS